MHKINFSSDGGRSKRVLGFEGDLFAVCGVGHIMRFLKSKYLKEFIKENFIYIF
jgi:hypothetical protein